MALRFGKMTEEKNSQKVKFDIGYDKIKAAAEFTIGKKG